MEVDDDQRGHYQHEEFVETPRRFKIKMDGVLHSPCNSAAGTIALEQQLRRTNAGAVIKPIAGQHKQNNGQR